MGEDTPFTQQSKEKGAGQWSRQVLLASANFRLRQNKFFSFLSGLEVGFDSFEQKM